MIINISDRKDTKVLLYNNTLSVEIKFHWQIIAFFLLYRWHSYINNVSLFTLGGNIARKDDFYCTCIASRKVWSKGRHTLDVIAARCGYDLTEHHHALADAAACAAIALKIL